MAAPEHPADRSDAADRGIGAVSDYDGHDAGEPRPVTFGQATDRYSISIRAARERYDELNLRDHLARVHADMRPSEMQDPREHGGGHAEPLSTDEHLELLAAAEYLSRVYRPSCQLDHALNAGATWEQVADALGTSQAAAQAAYRKCADNPSDFLSWADDRTGASDGEHDAATRRPEAEARRVAGPEQREAGS
jgi:hypothetical protein